MATVRIGPIGIGPDSQPAITRTTNVQRKPVLDCETTGFALPVPAGPWRVEVSVSPTFSPHDIDVNHGDTRQLGAVFTAYFQPLFATGTGSGG
jgi:hypothetical protein